jgi:tetratricopeptide (TPR) repeat protein
MDAFHKAIENDPEFGLPYSNLGWSYFSQGKFAEAISLYGKSLELLENDKDKAFTWDRLGEAYYQIGNFAKSAEAYQKANELGSNHNKAIGGSSYTLPRQANSLSGLVSPEVTDMDAEAGTQQGHEPVAEAEAGQVDQIAPDAEESVPQDTAGIEPEAKPEDAEAAHPGGNGNWHYPVSSQVNESRKETRIPWMPADMIAEPFPEPDTGEDDGQATVDYQEVDAEAESEEQVQAINLPVDDRTQELIEPQHIEEEMGHAQMEIPGQESNDAAVQEDDDSVPGSRLEIEIERYERTTSESPNNDRAWSKLGNLYKEVKLYDKASHAFEQASAVDPSNPDYHYQLGTVYTSQKNHADAALAYERVIELNSDNMLAHCALAASYRHLGMLEKADEHVAIARPSMEDENEYNRACFEAISGNTDEAIKLLTIAIENEQTTQDWITVDPDLDFIREDERFQALLIQPEESSLPQ